MRNGVGRNRHAGRLELVHGVGRRALGPVDPPGQQRGRSGRHFRNRQQDQPVELRDAVLVPVVLVRQQLEALTRHELRQLPRTGARRILAERVPVLAELFILRLRGHQQARQLIGKQRIRFFGREFDRVVVDLLPAFEARQIDLQLPLEGGVVGRIFLVEGAIDIENHGVGVEVRTVVKLDALTQLENPFRLVFERIPFGGERRTQVRRPVGPRQIVRDQRIVDGVAGEAHALGALIRCAVGQWDIRQRHRDAKRSLREGRGRRQNGNRETRHEFRTDSDAHHPLPAQ